MEQIKYSLAAISTLSILVPLLFCVRAEKKKPKGLFGFFYGF